MSALFTASGVQYLRDASRSLTMPYTVGFWFSTNSLTAGTMWGSGSNSGATAGYSRIYIISTPGIAIEAVNTAFTTSTGTLTTPAVTAGAWHYAVGRYISATNKRLSVLFPDGSIGHVQNTTSVTPSTGSMTLGDYWQVNANGADPFDGMIAEFFVADVDVQADGAQLQDQLLRQLAYKGPFGVPHLRSAMLDYRSLRTVLSADQDFNGDILFDGKSGRRVWTNNGTTGLVIPSYHPPLPGDYADLRIQRAMAMI